MSKFTPPTKFPAEYISRIGVKVVLLAEPKPERYVGYFEFYDGEITVGDWFKDGIFSKDSPAGVNDIFDKEETDD